MITMMKTCLIKQGIILLTSFVACYGIFCCWRVQKQFVFIVLSIQEWEAMRQILKEACCFDMTPAGTTEDDGDEGVKDLIEMTLKKMDHDKDGRVSFGDFEMTVKKDPLMMEAFGPCLPNSALGSNN